MYEIVIIGAGAAGLSAASTAIMQKPDTKILILERGNKCGRKLSASGNGKCNLTNSFFEKDCYFSNNSSFIEQFVDDNSPNDVIAFFEKCGLLVYEKDGYYYPLSDMARQVTDRLLNICASHRVVIEYDKCVLGIEPTDNFKSYLVKTTDNEYKCRKVIIATGSNSYPGLGGTECGYELIKNMDIDMTEIFPVLIPVYVDDDKLSIAQGVRINAEVTLDFGDKKIRERGQVQINNNNLSGIAIMNLSCYLPKIEQALLKDCFYIDYLPYMSWDKLKSYIKNQCLDDICDNILSVLEGIFPSKFAKYLLDKLNIDSQIIPAKITEKQINKITSYIKKMRYTPLPQYDNEKSQASLGGVNIDEICADSYETRKYEGVYIVGEALDITGKCGGYNLTFAILSGIKAAQNALDNL